MSPSPTSASAVPRPIAGPTSPQSSFLASGQSYLCLPTFTLDSGHVLQNVPIAYKTWGKLSPKADNALVVCHALTGSADVEDWWGPLLGPSKLFDPTRFFIFCANVLGSPYGSAGPCTRLGGEKLDEAEEKKEEEAESWDGKGWWGPEFPATTVRDDVRIQKLVLDYLGVEQIAAVVGGSMGGMAVLEWPLCFPVRFPSSSTSSNGASSKAQPYIRAIVPIATAARHSAWCISWAEAQRQSIYSDPAFDHGYYVPDKPPRAGLAAARMAALLTYRSRDSFESRFGRRTGKALRGGGAAASGSPPGAATAGGSAKGAEERRGSTSADDGCGEAARLHNEGNASPRVRPTSGSATPITALSAHLEASSISTLEAATSSSSTNGNGTASPPTPTGLKAPKVFSAQSYLRYQGDKFVRRFDANCYIHLTRKMDTHDVARGRSHWGLDSSADAAASEEEDENTTDEALARVLGLLARGTQRSGAPAPAVLVVSIESDGLFAPPEQSLIHKLIPGSEFVSVASPDGHDGFLLEFEQINAAVAAFLRKVLSADGGSDVWEGRGVGWEEWKDWGKAEKKEEKVIRTGGEKEAVKESMFGEVEDVTRW